MISSAQRGVVLEEKRLGKGAQERMSRQFYPVLTNRAHRHKELIYFLVITVLFLAFAIFKLQSDGETKPPYIVAGRYLFVFLLALTIGYFSGIPGFIGYLDMTRGKVNTLTPNTQKVLAQIGDEPMEITFYANILDPRFRIGSPEGRNEDLDRWSYYLRFKPMIYILRVFASPA